MWFKNLRIYRLAENLDLTDIEHPLKDNEFQACGQLDTQKYGWVSPLGRGHTMLSHTVSKCTMFCARRQEKLVPGAAVKEALENKIYEIREQEGRPVGRKERQSLKDELIFSLLPRALTRSSLEYGYVDEQHKLIYVDAGSAKRAEDFLSLLRETLGSLKATPLTPTSPMPQTLTQWVSEGESPAPFTLGDQCELRSSKDERSIRFRKQELGVDEVKQHIDTGMYVRRLSLDWNEAITFTLDDEFCIRGLKFADKLVEQANDQNADSEAATFDNEFAIMCSELAEMTKNLLHCVGGESHNH